MTEKQTIHPPKEQLEAFGLGKLEPGEGTEIEKHLDACPECYETMLELQDDTFVSLVKKSPLPVSEDTSADGSAADPSSHTAFQPTVLESDDGNTPVSISADETDLPRELQEHNRYRILEHIGHGGMGDVYIAEHMVMNRPVALKVIKPELVQNKSAIKRFHREVQAAARLHHGNIVTAHDAERAGNSHFLVMEFVDGVNLDEVLKERGPLPVAEACDVIRQTAQGLEHAHALGMVHRDIKPHNLMLTESGDVKILDFGLASFASHAATAEGESAGDSEETQAPTEQVLHQLTQMGAMMGTPDYIAPEQAKDARKADIRADIYSLGCTFYTLLTGKPPFKGETVAEKLTAHAQKDPEPLAKFRDDVPAEVEAIMRKMMAKDPAERYQTPAEVAEAIDLASVGRQPHEPNQRTGAHRSRNLRRRVLTAIGGLIAALVAFAVYYIQTDYGVVRIEVADESLNVELAGQSITMKDGEKEIKIRAGQQKLFVKHGDLEFYTDDFELRRGEELRFKVELSPGEVVVMKNGTPFDAERRPNVITLAMRKDAGMYLNDRLVAPGRVGAELMELIRKDPESEVSIDTVKAFGVASLKQVDQIAVMAGAKNIRWPDWAGPRPADPHKETKSLVDRMSKLKQIGVALTQYFEALKVFPPTPREKEHFDENGRPYLSWRVHLLPFLGEEELYKKFKLDEPWDSPHNGPLLYPIPDVYKTMDLPPIRTSFLAVVGKGTAYEGQAGLELKEFTDGLANVACLVDAASEKAVPWTKPEDLPFDSEDPIRAIGTPEFGDKFLALMADGSVKSIPYDTDPEQLRNLFLRADGNTLGLTKKRTTPLPNRGRAIGSGDPAVDKLLTDALAVYTFEEDAFYRDQGRMRFRDVSGHGQDASIEDDKNASAAEGKVGGGLACNRRITGFAPRGLPGSGIKAGDQNMYEMPMPKLRLPEAFLSGREEYTLTVWVRDAGKATAPSGKSLRMFFQEGFPKGNDAIYPLSISFVEKRLRAMCLGELIDPNNTNADAFPQEGILPKDEWFFLALTLVKQDDKHVLRITVNDKTFEQPFAAIPQRPEGGFGLIGGIDGMIDELAFFRRALSDEEIQKLRQHGLADKPLISSKKGDTPLPQAGPDQAVSLPGGIEAVRTLAEHTGVVQDLEVTPDGRLLVSAGAGEIIVRDAKTFKVLHKMQTERDGTAAIAVSPDSKLLATGGLAEWFELWDLSTGKRNSKQRGIRHDRIAQMQWAPDGKSLGVQSKSSTWVEIDIASGKTIRGLPTNGTKHIYSPDGRWNAFGDTRNFNVTVLDTANGEVHRRFTATSGRVRVLAFSADSKWLLAGGEIDARVWDVETGFLVAQLPTGSAVHAGAFLSDQHSVITGERDTGKLKVWDFDGVRVGKVVATADNVVLTEAGFALLPDGYVATAATNTLKAAGPGFAPLPGAEDNAELAANADEPGRIQIWKLPESVWPDAEPASPSDYDRLLGKWNAKTGVIEGKAAAQWGDVQYEFLPGKKMNMIFPKPKLQIVPATVTLDETARPKTIDFHLENGGVKKCLYELNGDELLLAMNLVDGNERPKRLVNLSGDTHVLLQLERDGLYESRIKSLVSEAAGIVVAQMEVLAKTEGSRPNIEDFDSKPLTAWLMSLDPKAEAEKNPEVRKDFEFLTEKLPKPAEMARALMPQPLRGYASFIQPEYITNVTLNIEGDMANGEVAFEKKGMYRGKVLYVARRLEKAWQIEELEMPNLGIKVVRDDEGKWNRKHDVEEISLLRELSGSKEWITAVAYPANDRAITVGVDGVVRVWKNGGKELDSHTLPFGGMADVSPDGKSVIVAGKLDDGDTCPVALWDIDPWPPKKRWEIKVPVKVAAWAKGKFMLEHYVNPKFAPSGRALIQNSHGVALVDTKDGKVLSRFAEKSGAFMNGASVSPDGKRLFVRHASRTDLGTFGRIYQIDDGKELAQIASKGQVLDSVWSPDGKHLLLAEAYTFEGTIAVFETDTGKLVRTIGIPQELARSCRLLGEIPAGVTG